MNKHLHIMYAVMLVVLIPLAGYAYLSTRSLRTNTDEQGKKLEEITQKMTELETRQRVEEMLRQQEAVAPQPEEPQESTPAADAAPDPVAEFVKNRAQYRIQVLNAKGVQGTATKVQQRLVEKGFTVAGTDNTGWQVSSTIRIKEGLTPLADLIKAELADEYTFTSVDAIRPDDGDVDVVVIIGSK